MTSLSVNLHARHGVAVVAITLGGSPVIIPILQRWKRRIGEVPSRPHVRGYRSRREGVTLHSSPCDVPVITGMLSQLPDFEQSSAA